MIRAILAAALIPLTGCGLPAKTPAPTAHAGTATPSSVEATIKQNQSVPKPSPPPATTTPSTPTAAAVLDAIGRAKDTVERRSYILDDRANKDMP
jgi:hypothetical protein